MTERSFVASVVFGAALAVVVIGVFVACALVFGLAVRVFFAVAP